MPNIGDKVRILKSCSHYGKLGKILNVDQEQIHPVIFIENYNVEYDDGETEWISERECYIPNLDRRLTDWLKG